MNIAKQVAKLAKAKGLNHWTQGDALHVGGAGLSRAVLSIRPAGGDQNQFQYLEHLSGRPTSAQILSPEDCLLRANAALSGAEKLILRA